jgi:amino-acid N-acetyltransferase
MIPVTNAAEAEIRRATSADLPAVERLLTNASLPTVGVAEHIDDFIVAIAADAIVGVVGIEYHGDYGLLRSTVVDPAWRGRRVAGRLVEQIIATAESRGAHALYLLTTTAERYFPSLGFSAVSRDTAPGPIRETEEYCSACPASATLMARVLEGTL